MWRALATLLALIVMGAVSQGMAQSTNAGPVAATKPEPADPWAPYEHWITGDVTFENNVLLFHTDKPVRGDSEGNVVVLGGTKDSVAALIPLLQKAAERKTKVRLFGALLPFNGSFKNHPGPLPNVEFIVWKLHDPSDPDVLPASQRISINGTNTTLGGKPTTLINDETGKPFQPGTVTPNKP